MHYVRGMPFKTCSEPKITKKRTLNIMNIKFDVTRVLHHVKRMMDGKLSWVAHLLSPCRPNPSGVQSPSRPNE